MLRRLDYVQRAKHRSSLSSRVTLFRVLPYLDKLLVRARTTFPELSSGNHDIISYMCGLTVDDSDDAEDAQQQRSRAHLRAPFSGGGSPSAFSLGERRGGRKRQTRTHTGDPYVLLSNILLRLRLASPFELSY